MKRGIIAALAIFQIMVAIAGQYEKIREDFQIPGYVWSFNVEKEIPAFFKDLQTKQVKSEDTIVWRNFGPGMSGYCDEFFIHPTDPNTINMNLDMGNAYVTNDNAISWQTIKEWDEDGEVRMPVWTDFSRQNPDFGMALDDKGRVMFTTDRGRSWDFRNWSAPKKNSVIAVDPNNESKWYIGAGQMWRVKDIHRSLANIHGTQYRNTEYGHIYKSTDKGFSWTKITDKFDPNLDVARIIVNPLNSNTVFMATNFGFYKSLNAGSTWTLKGTGLPYNQPRDLQSFYDPASGEFILYLLEQTHYADDGKGSVTTSGGLYQSLDGGESWTDITGNLAIDLSRINHYASVEKYYRAIAYWFDIDVATAKTRFPVMPKSVYTVFNRVVVNPKNKNEIYLSNNVKHDYSFTPGEIWKSENGGQTWFVTARYGTYWGKQTDKAYWESRNNPLGQNMKYAHMERDMMEEDILVGCRFMHANSEGDMLICVEQQVLRSSDGGVSWKQIDDFETTAGSGHWVGRGGSNLPGEHLLVETGMKSHYLFCSGEHGLWRNSLDGDLVYPDAVAVEQLSGQSKVAYDATSICAVAVHPNDTNSYYMLMFRQSHRGYFRATTDGGKTWNNLSYPVQYGGNLSSDHIFQYCLKIDPVVPDNIYFCVPTNKWQSYTTDNFQANGPADFTDYGVYRSQDGGLTWDRANSGFPAGASIHSLELDKNNPSVLYAGLNQNPAGEAGGLYKTANGGDSWSKLDIPSDIVSVNDVHMNPNSGYLYISCGRTRGSIDEGGVWVSRDDGLNWERIFYFPHVFSAHTSLNNPEVITVAAGPSNVIGKKNPGAYLSQDGGKSWKKINYGLGQPSRIREISPDPYDKNIFWAALSGSGWYKGMVKPGLVAHASGATVYEGDLVTLDASSSVGSNLSYQWTAPPELVLSENDNALVTFTAPDVDKETIFDVELSISDGNHTDVTRVKIIVRPTNTMSVHTPVHTSVKVFPNPVKQWLTIDGISGEGMLALHDLGGRKVLQQKVVNGQDIDVSGFGRGLFIGTITAENKQSVFKIIIE